MWQLDDGSAPPPDVARLLELVGVEGVPFAPDRPLVVARAPGRLDLMGGIADYSGSLVLQLPLAAATYVAAQTSPEPLVQVVSLGAELVGGRRSVAIPLQELAPGGRALPYQAARELLAADPDASWAAYVAGVLVVLHHERGLALEHGAQIVVHSDVPAGKGVSSSAALEVATMRALCELYGLDIAGVELATLCQKVENLVVGAPCGIMDQMTSACGEEDRLLNLLCQPAALQRAVDLPPELEVWGIDSGIRHAVSGSDYGAVRVGAFMGYRIIAEHAGLDVQQIAPGLVKIADPFWKGYLVNIGVPRWEQHFASLVPEIVEGQAFLARYGGIGDRVTRVDPARSYAVRQPTAHPIYEHRRVSSFRSLLASRPLTEALCEELGALMAESHASYSDCGLGSDGTDLLVELVRRRGPGRGLYGAKITGGGSGGTVAVLARRGLRPLVQQVADEYTRETGRPALVLGGSSPGAMQYGTRRLVWR